MIPRPLACLALGVATLFSPSPGDADVGLDVGDQFPEIVLPNLSDGEPLSMTAFRGQKVALHIWASW